MSRSSEQYQDDTEALINGVDSDARKKSRGVGWWHEDRSSVFLLLFLYILQGLPLGLAGSIPMVLAVSCWIPFCNMPTFINKMIFFGRGRTWIIKNRRCSALYFGHSVLSSCGRLSWMVHSSNDLAEEKRGLSRPNMLLDLLCTSCLGIWTIFWTRKSLMFGFSPFPFSFWTFALQLRTLLSTGGLWQCCRRKMLVSHLHVIQSDRSVNFPWICKK